MDLIGTEMVVLSACDTATGEVLAGEGVFGLRRAFELAGARTLIMSLWKVPDGVTCELMERYYSHLRNGEERLQALRIAQAGIRRKYPHPYYWAAFICQGYTRSLN
jgi:CHAT domain-containing protein